ncbi:MAG: glycosyltransferase [Chthoniobacteraceae bacterium]|nr:glycosyltransferase [Chthoniobacteraceae bacterium]
MKICDLTQFYSPVSGGVKRYVQEKVRYLHGHTDDDTHLLIIPGERDSRTEDGRAIVHTIRSPLLSRTSRYRAILRLGAIERILERERPDVIESGDPYQVAWKAIASGRGLGIPVIGFYHSHFPEAYLRTAARFFGQTVTELVMDASRCYVRALYNRFYRTLVPSPALERLLGDWGVVNTEHLDLGVDIEVFQPDPADGRERERTRDYLGVPHDRTLLLYVGRLAREKNTRTLFDAFDRLHHTDPGRYHLLVIGDGLQRRSVLSLQSATGQVTWRASCLERETLARIYRCADCFVHPGVQETFGLVTLESQACGTPVVGIRGSYMDRIIFSDQAHWARENTAVSLADAIAEVCAGDLRSAGLAASEAVRIRYSWNRVFGRLFEIYREGIRAYKQEP